MEAKAKAQTADRVHPLGPGQDAEDDLVERLAGAKEETAVEGPAGDLDQGTAFGDVAESSAHALIRRKNPVLSCKAPPGLSLRGGFWLISILLEECAGSRDGAGGGSGEVSAVDRRATGNPPGCHSALRPPRFLGRQTKRLAPCWQALERLRRSSSSDGDVRFLALNVNECTPRRPVAATSAAALLMRAGRPIMCSPIAVAGVQKPITILPHTRCATATDGITCRKSSRPS